MAGLGSACLTTRLTEAGDIKASAGILYWLLVSNWDSDPAYVYLCNATSGTGSIVGKFYVAGSRTEFFGPFDPAISMGTAIRIGTFSTANMEVTGGYGG